MMFVGVNCALNFDDKRNLPPWLQDAQKLAELYGGVRLAISWRNGSAFQGGSNTLFISIGPLPEVARGSNELWGCGHMRSQIAMPLMLLVCMLIAFDGSAIFKQMLVVVVPKAIIGGNTIVNFTKLVNVKHRECGCWEAIVVLRN